MEPQWRVRDPGRVREVVQSGLVDDGPRESLDRLAKLAAMLLEAPFAFVTVVDDAHSHYSASAGLPDGSPNCGEVEGSFCQYVVDDDDALLVDDARVLRRTRDNPAIESMGVVAWAGFPIHLPSGQPLGSFCVVDGRPRTWTDRDAEVLRTLARSATAEIELWLRLREEQIRRRRAEAIAHASGELGSAITVEGVMSVLAHVDWHTLDIDLGALVLLDDDDSLVVAGRWGDHPTTERWHRFDLSVGSPVGDVIRSGRPQYAATLSEIEAKWPAMSDVARARGYEAWAAMPIEIGGRVQGGLTALSREARDFRARSHELSELSARLGQALTRAARYDAERAAALQLQVELLGELPERAGGLEVTGRYVAGSPSLSIGGDFYDVLQIGPDLVLFVIGDVVGHGLGAAAAMARLKGGVRALAPLRSPAAILHALDTMTDLEPELFAATMMLAAWHPNDQRFVVACAGHPPAVLIEGNAPAVFVEGGRSTPLGVTRGDARRDEVVVDVGENFTIVLYTDGVYERRRTDSDERLSHLLNAFQTTRDHPHSAMIDAVLDTMTTNTSVDRHADDMAVLVISGGRPGA